MVTIARQGSDGSSSPTLLKFNPESFFKSMEKSLPFYARPIFVRIVNRIEVTGE